MMTPRDYQRDCVDAVVGELSNGSTATLAVLPTGMGKTVVFALVAQHWVSQVGGRVLVLAHREELIWQAQDKILAAAGIRSDIEMAELHADDGGLLGPAPVVVASVQTLTSGPRCHRCACPYCPPRDDDKECESCGGSGRLPGDCPSCAEGRQARMLKFRPDDFGLLIIDEAHHATAATYQRVIRHFRQNARLRILGVTATPDRHDEEAMGQVFDSCAYQYGILDGIQSGWLVPICQQLVRVEGLDFSGCRTTAGDLNEGDVARAFMPAADVFARSEVGIKFRNDGSFQAMDLELTPVEREQVEREERLLHAVADPTVQLAGDRPTLLFAASVAHAERLAEIVNRHKPGQAVCIHGRTPIDERRGHLRRFAAGEYQYLVNCGVFLEGFDEPRVACVAIARPTKSRALYAQMIGRGTRPTPGTVDHHHLDADGRRESIAITGKDLLVLDFVGNSGKHKLVTVAAALDGKLSDEVADRARAIVATASQEGRPQDVCLAMAAAAKQVEAEAKARRRQVRARSTYRTQAVDPFDLLDLTPAREPGWHKGRKPTAKQLAMLASAGMPTTAETTFWEASQLIGEIVARRERGLCTYKQAKLLARFGEDPDTSFEAAGPILDEIVASGWQPRQRKVTI